MAQYIIPAEDDPGSLSLRTAGGLPFFSEPEKAFEYPARAC
jgi:hypothetical protein